MFYDQAFIEIELMESKYNAWEAAVIYECVCAYIPLYEMYVKDKACKEKGLYNKVIEEYKTIKTILKPIVDELS